MPDFEQNETFPQVPMTEFNADYGLWDKYTPGGFSELTRLPPLPPVGYQDSSADPFRDARAPQVGVEFSAPNVSGEDNRLLPLGGGELNPRTRFNYWNPISGLNTLATMARAFIPGVNDAGMFAGEIGRSLADSYVGKALSESPFAKAAEFAGEAVAGVFKGIGTILGDAFEPWGDITKSYQEQDWGGVALNTLRLGAFSVGENLVERVKGFMDGDEKKTAELVDELSALVTVGTLGAGAATGLLGRAGVGLGRAASKAGVYDLGRGALKPNVELSLSIARRTMAAGYGGMIGLEVAERALDDDEIKYINEVISKSTFIPKESPFYGITEFGAAVLVDPLPLIGKIAESRPVRQLMDSGVMRLPAPLETLSTIVPAAEKYTITPELIQRSNVKLLYQVSRRDLENQMHTLITDDMLESRFQHNMSVLRGDAGTAADYTDLHARMRDELVHEIKVLRERDPKFETKPITADDWIERFEAEEAAWNVLKPVEEGILARNPSAPRHLLIRNEALTTRDVDEALDFLQKNRKSFRDNPVAPEENAYEALLAKFGDTARGLRTRTVSGMTKELQEMRPWLPVEPDALEMGLVARQIRGQGYYKVIVKGERTLLKRADDYEIPEGHPVFREMEQLVGRGVVDKALDASAGRSMTMKQAAEFLVENDVNPDVLWKWTQDTSAYYSHKKGGLTRPIIKPRPEYVSMMPIGATKVGRWVAGFREWVPNTELAAAFREKFYRTHLESLGPGVATQSRIEQLIDEYKKLAESSQAVHLGQAGTSYSPMSAGDKMQQIFVSIFGEQAGKQFRAAQLLEDSMPRESFKKFLNVVLGNDTGAVGAFPSVAAAMRARYSNKVGDFYRWWANVGHPMLRYDLSPTFQLQLPLESAVFNFLRGTAFAPTDPIIRQATSEMMDDIIRKVAGKRYGERFGLPSAEASLADINAGRQAREHVLRNRIKYMEKLVAVEFPDYFAKYMKQAHPKDWALLKKEFKTDRNVAVQVMQNRQAVRDFLSGKISKEDLLNKAALVRKHYEPIEAKLPSAGTFAGRAEALKYQASRLLRRQKETRDTGYDYVIPKDPKAGWRLDLNVRGDLGDTTTREIAEFLDERGYHFEVSDQIGRGITINVGDRDTVDELAKELNRRFKLPDQADLVKGDDIRVIQSSSPLTGPRLEIGDMTVPLPRGAEYLGIEGRKVRYKDYEGKEQFITLRGTGRAKETIKNPVLDEDVQVAGGVWARFVSDEQLGLSGSRLTSFNEKGVPYLDYDLASMNAMKGDRLTDLGAFDRRGAQARAHAALEDHYGAFYTGTGPGFQLPGVQRVQPAVTGATKWNPPTFISSQARKLASNFHLFDAKEPTESAFKAWAQARDAQLQKNVIDSQGKTIRRAVSDAKRRKEQVDLEIAAIKYERKNPRPTKDQTKEDVLFAEVQGDARVLGAPLLKAMRQQADPQEIQRLERHYISERYKQLRQQHPANIQRELFQAAKALGEDVSYSAIARYLGEKPAPSAKKLYQTILNELEAIRLEAGGHTGMLRGVLGVKLHSKTLPAGAPAYYDPGSKVIYFDPIRIRKDYESGMSYLRSKDADKTKFVLRGLSVDDFKKLMDQYGGAEAYEQFIINHEIAHHVLGSKATEAEAFQEGWRRFIRTRREPPSGLPPMPKKKVAVDIDEGKSILEEMDHEQVRNAIATWEPILGAAESALRDAVRQAQVTHISNPMRRYWERSLSHPMLMYPLSWTIKATGEWAKFLTSSMFGVKTGMGGLVLWEDVKDATIKVLANDPDAEKWITEHPATFKLMEYLIPGTPLGVGFGMVSVPLRNVVQLGYNFWNGQKLDDNMNNMAKIGLLRDVGPNGFLEKMWSEWMLGKPMTSLDNPGLTSGKKRVQQGLDSGLEPGLKEILANRR